MNADPSSPDSSPALSKNVSLFSPGDLPDLPQLTRFLTDHTDKKNLLTVGDVMLDCYIYGQVSRISPEAPVPVIREERRKILAGGAANVAGNLAALGTTSFLIGIVGDDQSGAALMSLIGESPRTEPFILIEEGRQTTIKTRYLAGGQHILRADNEETKPVSQKAARECLSVFKTCLDNSSVVILSDYAKGMLAETSAPLLLAAAQKAGCLTIVDPKGKDYARYAGAFLITPNRHELAEATQMPASSHEEIEAAARFLQQKYHFQAVLVTRSEEGMSLLYENNFIHYPTTARSVFDVSGAGDSVVAMLAHALSCGLPLQQAVYLANVAAGISVGKVGTATVNIEEVLTALDEKSDHNAKKITDRQAAFEQTERWKYRRLKVGFTNGCFDILHPGHVSLLEEAKKHCDKLIVGLNSDASVRRLKGPSRPVTSETSRAGILAALSSVDLVSVFEEDTPLELLKLLKPDILFKGADYTKEQVVGAGLIEEQGGKVILLPLLSGHSTTATIRKIKQP